MYLRVVHAEHDMATLRAFVRANPLGLVTTAIDAPGVPFLQASHIPFLLDIDEGNAEGLGKLRGHLARANPQAKAMIAEREREGGGNGVLERDVLVVFTAQAHAYVTPKFYTATKPASGKVVPTWDYAAVEVHGRARVFFDLGPGSEDTDAFLQRALEDLSAFAETELARHERPWAVGDAPAAYVALRKKAIVGVEIEITDMAGKWKMGQELSEADRRGVVDGFAALGTELGAEIAETVRRRAPTSAA